MSLPHTLTLETLTFLTHDTVQLEFDRPEGFEFTPGQATHWGLDVDGMRDAGNPFTITSLPHEERLEFVIKTYPTDEYPDHGGVTERIAKMQPGEKIFMDNPSGDIADKGPGVFVAGGAGITPFIPILKERRRSGTLDGCTLVFSNKTERDIILRELWDDMAPLTVHYTLTDEAAPGIPEQMVDADYLEETTGLDNRFYICGPPPMMEGLIEGLRQKGVPDDRIIVEEKWLE